MKSFNFFKSWNFFKYKISKEIKFMNRSQQTFLRWKGVSYWINLHFCENFGGTTVCKPVLLPKESRDIETMEKINLLFEKSAP